MENTVVLLLLVWLLRRRKRRREIKRHRKYKTRPVFQRRSELGEMRLMREVYERDNEIFKKCFRMEAHKFDYILSRIGASISKSHDSWIDSICARQRLAITLRYERVYLKIQIRIFFILHATEIIRAVRGSAYLCIFSRLFRLLSHVFVGTFVRLIFL